MYQMWLYSDFLIKGEKDNRMNECLTTPHHKNKLAIGCQTNGIYIKSKKQICI